MERHNSDALSAVNSAIQNFNVGTRILLRTQRESGASEHFSSLIGYVRDEFLLVKSPVVRNTPFVFNDGEKLLVRAFTGTTIYSFASMVTRTFLSPLYYMHLTYPQEVSRSALRSALRVKVNLPVQVAYTDAAGARQASEASLVNLSLSGAGIESDAPVVLGSTLDLSFTIRSDGSERAIRTQGLVRSVNVRPAGGPQARDIFACGLEFKDLDTEDQTMIRLLTYETLLMDRQNIA